MHPDQLAITTDTVTGLIATQFPQWRELAVVPVRNAGTVNAIFRVGDELAARFPLQGSDPVAADRVLTEEAAAAGEFASVSSVPSPEPVAIGSPGRNYPLPWSIQTWVAGTDGMVEDPSSSLAFARDLTGLIRTLRSVDTNGRTFAGSNRGGHLVDHDEWMRTCFERSVGLVEVPRLAALWSELRGLPEIDSDVMGHGDLIPMNVLVRGGRLAGVLDTGGFAAADPALDLVGAWHLLDAPGRQLLRAELDCSEIQWRRGMAWALEQAMGVVWYYVQSNPNMSRWGRRTLDRLLDATAGE